MLHIRTLLRVDSKQGPLIGQYKELSLGVKTHGVYVVNVVVVLEDCGKVGRTKESVLVDALDGVGMELTEEQDIVFRVKCRRWGYTGTTSGAQDLEEGIRLELSPVVFPNRMSYLVVIVIQDFDPRKLGINRVVHMSSHWIEQQVPPS